MIPSPPSSDGCGLGADTLQLTNGSALHFNRREEPKLLLDRHTNLPLALYNVVDDSFLYNETRIIVQELDYSDEEDEEQHPQAAGR